MATTLMSTPCGDVCGEETDYLVTFGITELEMTDAKRLELFNQVFIIVAWDGNVVKLRQSEESEEFKEQHSWDIHLTPQRMSEKLKTSPIMLNLVRGCDDLGNTMISITECFSDAILCEDFNSETVIVDFKFVLDNQENGSMKAFFRVQKLLEDGISGNLFKSLKKKLARSRKATKKSGDDDEFESDDDDGHDPCDDFVCPDELSEQCKLEMGLGRDFYRIINGNLINMKNKAGPCGDPCEAGKRLSRDAKKSSEDAPIFSTRFKFKDCLPNCNEIFTTPATKPLTSYATRPRCDDDWIDRNINEEDLLRKLCKKYGIDVADLKEEDSKVELKGKKVKESKKSKVKCAKKIKCKTVSEAKIKCKTVPEVVEQPKTCEPEKKPRVPRLYSFKYGNHYPLHRSCSHIEEGAGDSQSVPKNMSWRWDKPVAGVGKPWTPGQINPTVRCLMKHALNPFPYDTIPLTRRDKFGRIVTSAVDRKKRFLDNLVQKPTIEVKKRDGQYCIIMNPLKDKKELGTDCNPYLNCSPFKFTIKKHPEQVKKHQAKKILRSRGLVKKCSCTTLECCRCKTQREKKVIKFEMKKVSQNLDLKKDLEYEDIYASSDSETEMHFTTPSALVDRRKFKPDVVHCETQYGVNDFLLTAGKNGEPSTDGVKNKVSPCPSRSAVVTIQKCI